MISPHLKDRFFQRYGRELTPDILRQLRNLADAAPGEPDKHIPTREHVSVVWGGHSIRLVWTRATRYVYTFLPPVGAGLRLAWCTPKRKKGRGGRR